MLGQAAAAQFDLENVLAEFARSGATVTGQTHDQLQSLGRLIRQIGAADAVSLVAMRAEVTAAIAATQTLAQQSRAAVAEAKAADALGLTGSAAASRAQVTALMHDIHRFDPYLRFGSAEEEEAYRKREADRAACIAAEQAKGTPEGDLNASAGAIGQMTDIKAHGGGDSPEFQARWDALVATTGKLREEVRRSGGSTAEFDNRLREDLRRILRAKGLTDAQIDAQFAAHPDPLEAAKAYVASDDDFLAVRQSTEKIAATSEPATTIVAAAAPPPGDDMGDAMAKFRSAGLVATEHSADEAFAHGVAAGGQAPAIKGRA